MGEGLGKNKAQEELARLMFSYSGGALITMRDNLQVYLSGRENPRDIRNISHYTELDKKYREFTNAEISELIQGLR